MYDLDIEGVIILLLLSIVTIDCNFVINQWIIFVLGQNNNILKD
jgi:hypothetical protein